MIWKLHKSLYGLRQSGRNWNKLLSSFLISLRFKSSENDPCLFNYNLTKDIVMTIIVWVDDLLITFQDNTKIDNVVSKLAEQFELTDKGEVKTFLGMNFSKDSEGNWYIDQRKLINKLLFETGMLNCKPSYTLIPEGMNLNIKNDEKQIREGTYPYREVIGTLNYLSTHTRPDLSWIVSILSAYNSNPNENCIKVVKHVLRYLKGTVGLRLVYYSSSKLHLNGYSDADWANSTQDRRSYSGYLFRFGEKSSPISWSSKKQSLTALSTCEAEFIALTEATKESSYIRHICEDLEIGIDDKIKIFCDNTAAIALSNGTIKSRNKHIDMRVHYLREGNFAIYVPSERNQADALTKGLGKVKLEATLRDYFPANLRGGVLKSSMPENVQLEITDEASIDKVMTSHSRYLCGIKSYK